MAPGAKPVLRSRLFPGRRTRPNAAAPLPDFAGFSIPFQHRAHIALLRAKRGSRASRHQRILAREGEGFIPPGTSGGGLRAWAAALALLSDRPAGRLRRRKSKIHL